MGPRRSGITRVCAHSVPGRTEGCGANKIPAHTPAVGAALTHAGLSARPVARGQHPCGEEWTLTRTDELAYDLPTELIATRPAGRRDGARLLVVSRTDPSRLEHLRVRDLPQLVGLGDAMVFNTSRVIPARFLGERLDTGGKIEGLYLADAGSPDRWVVLLKSRRFKAGAPIAVFGRDGRDSGVRLVMLCPHPGEPGAWVVLVQGDDDPGSVLERVGLTPLPPYIRSARKQAHIRVPEEADRERYQTVFAAAPGSVAAPTAGLHFTPELLAELKSRGVERDKVVLHVGSATFRAIESDDLEGHDMHEEWCSVSAETLARLGAAARVIAVGTTTARALESYADAGDPPPPAMRTKLFVAPGYRWQLCDGMLTNFHLPRSTLMAMVASLFPRGIDRLKEIYAEAVKHRYRFYSYGDAMLVLP